jgi:hypothetical protein
MGASGPSLSANMHLVVLCKGGKSVAAERENVEISPLLTCTDLLTNAIGLEHSTILRKVFTTRRLSSTAGSTVVPHFAVLKGWTVEMKCHRRDMGTGISHLVQTDGVVDKGHLTFPKSVIGNAFQTAPFLGWILVTTFLDFSLQHLEPAAITGMVVDLGFRPGIPAEQEQREALVVRVDQVSCVSSGRIKMSVGSPVFGRELEFAERHKKVAENDV